jgi:hypothetical protein
MFHALCVQLSALLNTCCCINFSVSALLLALSADASLRLTASEVHCHNLNGAVVMISCHIVH